MDKISEVKVYETSSCAFPMMVGGPGPDTLHACKDILLQATTHLLTQEGDVSQPFRYGDEKGDQRYRDELAKFLSKEYKDTVDSSNLMLTAGATQGLHMAATLLFGKGTTVFVEEPTYYAAYRMLLDDFQMNLVPVPTDENGMDSKTLDKLLTDLQPKSVSVTEERPFWSMVYVIPAFNNPTGHCYSPERCRDLVRIARKHDVLIFAEDIYNLIYFGKESPKRLLSYDVSSDPDYKGHVVSNGTFSKILAPGLRVGWLEAPTRVLKCLLDSNIAWSGGSLNHYASKLVAAVLELGLEDTHVKHIRQVYKERMELMCSFLGQNLPAGSFHRSEGGFFVWVKLPESVDAFLLLRMAFKKHSLNFLPGFCASPSGGCNNFLRLSISFLNKENLTKGLTAFCAAVKEYMAGDV